ncbi:MAG TPA: hypothetical protein H9979_07190 [Candidatus Megamonas gallistercoris]|uniref:hypothetical protein n=1 Tax=Megamonas hypermegale TaxID=158847 RepID=UPI001C3BBF8D|nr:hypothetical protein [Megamonas hypermegale]HIX84302.1 hypothetical protein [Candidatus Megamonas gallistercoris]
MINLVVVLLVLGVVFMMMSPETNSTMSVFSEITMGAVAIFIVITIIRMIIAGRRK